MKKYSSLLIKEMDIKTTVRCHHQLIKIAKLKRLTYQVSELVLTVRSINLYIHVEKPFGKN